jgi:hypothetical protein
MIFGGVSADSRHFIDSIQRVAKQFKQQERLIALDPGLLEQPAAAVHKSPARLHAAAHWGIPQWGIPAAKHRAHANNAQMQEHSTTARIFDAAKHRNTAEQSLLPSRFVRVLKAAAGVRNGTSKGLQNTVIITVANFHNVKFVNNFHCSMQMLGYRYALLSLDQQMHSFAVANGFPSMFDMRFGASSYNKILAAKPLIALEAMKLGLDPLITDNDLVWTSNWIDQINQPLQSSKYDLLVSTGYSALVSLLSRCNGSFTCDTTADDRRSLCKANSLAEPGLWKGQGVKPGSSSHQAQAQRAQRQYFHQLANDTARLQLVQPATAYGFANTGLWWGRGSVPAVRILMRRWLQRIENSNQNDQVAFYLTMCEPGAIANVRWSLLHPLLSPTASVLGQAWPGEYCLDLRRVFHMRNPAVIHAMPNQPSRSDWKEAYLRRHRAWFLLDGSTNNSASTTHGHKGVKQRRAWRCMSHHKPLCS